MPAFDELVAELRSVVQRHRPEWTNSGDGDPGVTLVELFAFLGDEVLYRANQLPERWRPRVAALMSRLARQWMSRGASTDDCVSGARVGFTRVRYFRGQLLSADDFTAEQEYVREKREMHNRLLHGDGVVSGLETKVGTSSVTLSPGLALDPRGREIVVACPVELALPRERRSSFLSLEYRERETDPVPAGDAMQATRVEEGYELSFAPAPVPGAVLVAQLVRRSGRWRLDKRFRVRRVTGRGRRRSG
jgi:hypothetical protein